MHCQIRVGLAVCARPYTTVYHVYKAPGYPLLTMLIVSPGAACGRSSCHHLQIIKALQYDVAKVSKAHNDLIRVYEAKLTEFGVPVDELGFRPLVTNTSTGPAGLVVGA